MRFLPVFLNIRQRPCLVVGGGEVAARKIRLLLQADADVRVVAPDLCATVSQWLERGRVHHVASDFTADTLERAALVVAATDDAEVNRRVSVLAQRKGIPVNVVDAPALCSFVMPSIVDRSPVVVAISSGGASPVLARLLRARLETLLPAAYGGLASLVESFRDRVKRRFARIDERRRFWEEVLEGPVAEMFLAGRRDEAEAALERQLQHANAQRYQGGEVYLVGAGPGDPDLLTFRALRLMQQAEVVLYDRLVPNEILELTRRDADRIFVGKEKSRHALRQEEINKLLVKLAREGKRVLRLKGGDPFIFGRGGEEIDTLAADGIPFQVIPGVTAASGCAAYAGIPLTHREYAQSCLFVTGHLKDGSMNLNWEQLVQPQQTVVIYMGLTGLEQLCAGLIEHDMAKDTPAALIEQGTTPRQRVLAGSIDSLPRLVNEARVQAPTLVIVGEVVRLHARLAWYRPEAV